MKFLCTNSNKFQRFMALSLNCHYVEHLMPGCIMLFNDIYCCNKQFLLHNIILNYQVHTELVSCFFFRWLAG